MAPHSSTLAWKIPWMEEPGGLQSMGLLQVGHDATSLSLFTFMLWRRKWQPTPEFLPGEPQGWGSLVGCRLWGCTESDRTEATQQQQQQQQQQQSLPSALHSMRIWYSSQPSPVDSSTENFLCSHLFHVNLPLNNSQFSSKFKKRWDFGHSLDQREFSLPNI